MQLSTAKYPVDTAYTSITIQALWYRDASCTMHQEENLQAAMLVTKKARAAWPTGTIRGKKKKQMSKKELSKIKPSELLKRDGEIDTSTDGGDLEDPNDNVFDL